MTLGRYTLFFIFLISTYACEDETIISPPEEEIVIPPVEEEEDDLECEMIDSTYAMRQVVTLSFNEIQDTVGIRLSNVSDHLFEDIVFSPWHIFVSYGDIPPEEFSDYQYFPYALRAAFVELTIECDRHNLSPTDGLGELPLKRGNYTYQIDFDESENVYSKIKLTVIED